MNSCLTTYQEFWWLLITYKYDDKLDDVRIVESVLRSLEQQLVYIVTIIEETKDIEAMKMEQLLGVLQIIWLNNMFF